MYLSNDYNPETYFEKLFTMLPLAKTEQDFLDLLPLKEVPHINLGPSLNRS